jgi:hypothetical protein
VILVVPRLCVLRLVAMLALACDPSCGALVPKKKAGRKKSSRPHVFSKSLSAI